MNVKLLFGQGALDLRLPDSLRVLETVPMQPILDPTRAVHEALARPVESPPLAELARGIKTACVVVSDITRPVPNRVILPPVFETLLRSGIRKGDVTILIATGMHRPNLGDELASLVGSEIMHEFEIVNHYCRRPGTYRKIDEIDGAPIEINRRYLDAELKILTGLIEPHFYAGFSGGRKSILPGISSFETMKFMHSYKMIDHPNVTNCLLEGNPFHEYGLRVTERAGADFIVNAVIDKERRLAGVFAGHYNHAHLRGCRMVYKHAVVELDHRVDLVITSGGGSPLDATFYQISKALIGARDILKKGGSIVVACECREGLGSPEFRGILGSVGSPRDFFERYCDPDRVVIDQWCAQNIYQVLDHAGKVYVHSPGLSGEEIERMGAVKVENLQETVDHLLKNGPSGAVIPEGPYVVGKVKGARATS